MSQATSLLVMKTLPVILGGVLVLGIGIFVLVLMFNVFRAVYEDRRLMDKETLEHMKAQTRRRMKDEQAESDRIGGGAGRGGGAVCSGARGSPGGGPR